MIDWIRELGRAAKAVFAFFVTGMSSLVAVLVGDATLGDVTDGQWLWVVLSALIAGGGVYGISNSAPASTQLPSPPDPLRPGNAPTE